MTLLDRNSQLLSKVRMWIFLIAAGIFLMEGWNGYAPGFFHRLMTILQLMAVPVCLHWAWREFRSSRHEKLRSHISSRPRNQLLSGAATERRRSASVTAGS